MGKSTKKYIDKKNASTFHVLHRSQRDVGGDGTSQNVLWPSPNNFQETNEAILAEKDDTVLSKWEETAAEVGLLDDDSYDYDQHMKPITGTGDYFDSTGHRDNAMRDPRGQKHEIQDSIKEVDRKLESIALTPECMDEEVAQAMFGDFQEGDFEEILDDFCITAAEEPDEEEEEGFNFDAHIAALMEKARRQDAGEGLDVNMVNHEYGKNDATFFSKSKALGQVEEGEEQHYEEMNAFETAGIVPKLQADEERALCDKFEQTLLEYDSDDVGDLDEECDFIGGDRPLEGDKQLEAALDEFLVERKDEIFMEGTAHLPENKRTGGSGFSALVGKNMVPAESLYENMGDLSVQEVETIDETLADADITLADPELRPPEEEVLIDGKSYFSERTRNPWDCESILSTYSNLDNNPTTIERRRKGKKNSNRNAPDSVPEEEPMQIKLSNKSGLPLGVLESRTSDYDEVDDTYISVNKGEARKRNETVEEKKSRKLAVKQEREIARLQKKMMKEAFKDEFLKRSDDFVANDVAGKSVFRYA